MTNMVLLSEGGIRNHPLHPNHPYHYPSKPICFRKPHRGVEWESRPPRHQPLCRRTSCCASGDGGDLSLLARRRPQIPFQ